MRIHYKLYKSGRGGGTASSGAAPEERLLLRELLEWVLENSVRCCLQTEN